MKKVAFKDVKKFGTPPKHFNVVSGRFQGETETGQTEEFVLGQWDSLYIGPGENRSIINNTSKPATMIIVANSVQK